MHCLRLQHIVLFFSMYADIFCGWNLFEHHVFLPAIAIMSSQNNESCNLLTCIGAETPAYMKTFLCVQPDTRFCLPLSIRSWKNAHPLWGHDNTSIWLLTNKCGSCFRVALRQAPNWSEWTWQLRVGVLTTRAKRKTSLPTNMQWINSEWWIVGLYETLEQAGRCHYMRELEAWFESVHKMNQMDAIEKMNTSTQIHDTKANIMNLDKEENLLANKSCNRSGHSQHQVLLLLNDRGAAELKNMLAKWPKMKTPTKGSSPPTGCCSNFRSRTKRFRQQV